jgi:acyl carrier protein phosphodiesterase
MLSPYVMINRSKPPHSEIIMNYLFHLFLSGDDPEILTGNFMGDFVKGPLGDAYPPRLRQGIELHRRIDSFARDQDHFNRSRLRIDPSFGLYRGILVDLYYDHFLARSWSTWSQEPLEDYLTRVRKMVESYRPHLPERLREIVPIIFEDLLPSYREPAGVGRALERMSSRIKRANPLAAGGAELTRHYDDLQEDFLGFIPEARTYSAKLAG